MLKKIDCVMIRVNDVAEAINFYAEVFGLKPVWQDDRWQQAGLLFPESDAEIVLHCDPNIPGQVEVHYLVDDVITAVQSYTTQGCTVVTPPFEVRMGNCAVIQDPFGTRLCLLDASKGLAERTLVE
jgi:predicted enzyme related to lactoylglutathione lyase